MKRYGNISGESGVVAYDIRAETIHVRFTNGVTYVYDAAGVGQSHFQTMKQLATAGSGLSTFISQHVHDRFSSKY